MGVEARSHQCGVLVSARAQRGAGCRGQTRCGAMAAASPALWQLRAHRREMQGHGDITELQGPASSSHCPADSLGCSPALPVEIKHGCQRQI